jgi:hypothetical protein
MWLIMTALAAVIATAIWYMNAPGDKYKLGLLSLMLWGATIMWLVDHVIAYLTKGGEFFEVSTDATMLGVSVIFRKGRGFTTLPFLFTARARAELPSLLADRPDQGNHPADERPAEEEVQQEDGQGVFVVPGDGDDGRQEIDDQEHDENENTDKAAKEKSPNVHQPLLLLSVH